ncbi:MAG: hypothetical protein ACXVEE_21360 [Polyangiales bacterium]
MRFLGWVGSISLLVSCASAAVPRSHGPIHKPEKPVTTVKPRTATVVGTVLDAQSLVLDDDAAYVLSHDLEGHVLSLPKSGGAKTVLLPGDGVAGTSPFEALAQMGPRVFFTHSRVVEQPGPTWFVMSRIVVMAKSGGKPIELTTSVSHRVVVRGVAASTSWVYWLEGSADTVPDFDMPARRVVKAPAEGGAPVLVASGLPAATELAIDATRVFVAAHGVTEKQGGSILRLPIEGGASTRIAVGQIAPTALTLDATRVYWMVADELRALAKDAPEGSAPQVVLSKFDPSTTRVRACFAIDDDHVYWTTGDAVMRAKKDGTDARERIGSAPSGGGPIAVDAHDVYYVDGTKLMKLPKAEAP